MRIFSVPSRRLRLSVGCSNLPSNCKSGSISSRLRIACRSGLHSGALSFAFRSAPRICGSAASFLNRFQQRPVNINRSPSFTKSWKCSFRNSAIRTMSRGIFRFPRPMLTSGAVALVPKIYGVEGRYTMNSATKTKLLSFGAGDSEWKFSGSNIPLVSSTDGIPSPKSRDPSGGELSQSLLQLLLSNLSGGRVSLIWKLPRSSISTSSSFDFDTKKKLSIVSTIFQNFRQKIEIGNSIWLRTVSKNRLWRTASPSEKLDRKRGQFPPHFLGSNDEEVPCK